MIQTKHGGWVDMAKKTKSSSVEISKQRDISVSEFFSKNRHLLGFDNPKKALLTVIKEAVDNSLDACEEAGIIPEISIEVTELNTDRFHVAIEDNGPGIAKNQISRIFAKLLYGSKFHSLKMSRGQQGIGISAAVMYSQITTGKASNVLSKTKHAELANSVKLQINLQKNKPEVISSKEKEWDKKHGTRISMELEAKYQKGKQSVDEYIRLTAIANPHLKLTYKLALKKGNAESKENPLDNIKETVFERASNSVPLCPKAIKPHPYGVELGILMRMLKQTKAKTLKSFLVSEFSRVSTKIAEEICSISNINPKIKPLSAGRNQAENIYNAIQKVKIMNPATNCISPIGEEDIISGLKREVEADFYTSVTRPPAVYRGNPFQIELGIAYGGENLKGDELVQVIRLANRVPLLYQQSGCASFKTIVGVDWKNYKVQQSRGALPTAPMIILIHMASVWVPFTSESKEAISAYPEIIKEIRLATQEAGRKLAMFIRKRKRVADEQKKHKYIEKYIPQIGLALKELLLLDDNKVAKTTENLKIILEESRKN